MTRRELKQLAEVFQPLSPYRLVRLKNGNVYRIRNAAHRYVSRVFRGQEILEAYTRWIRAHAEEQARERLRFADQSDDVVTACTVCGLQHHAFEPMRKKKRGAYARCDVCGAARHCRHHVGQQCKRKDGSA